MAICYAQNFEDIVLHRAFKNQKSGKYIDIGAWDPVLDSTTKLFYDLGWSGINIEPLARFHTKLVQARPRDVNVRCVVGSRDGVEVDFLDLGDNSNMHSYRHTPDAKTVAAYNLQPKRVKVNMITLDTIVMSLAANVTIDFVKIDVEGAEADIINHTNWIAFRPKVLVIEAVEPITFKPIWHEWEPTLLAANYDLALFDGLNRFYCSKEHQNLWPLLSVPANVTDGFLLHPGHGLRG